MKKDLRYSGKENLREFYITPLYLETMAKRARDWSDAFLEEQIELFRHTIPDYPEVAALLEEELHRRSLNRLYRQAKSASAKELEKLLETEKREKRNPDFEEVVRAEMEIRKGLSRLTDRATDSGDPREAR